MNLAHKTNRQIEEELTRIVKSELSLVIEGVLYFCEVVKRNMHLAGRHSSLFTYLVDKGYTRDQALVRKDAVLLLIELPELKSEFVNRHLSMSALHHMRQIFRRELRRRKKAKLESLSRERKIEVARQVSRESSRDTPIYALLESPHALSQCPCRATCVESRQPSLRASRPNHARALR
jgi:hypothetical protein